MAVRNVAGRRFRSLRVCISGDFSAGLPDDEAAGAGADRPFHHEDRMVLPAHAG